MTSNPVRNLSQALIEAGYGGLFLSGSNSSADALWRNGENRNYLEQIVQGRQFEDLARLLASELLYQKVPGYPPEEWKDSLGYLYSQALEITGNPSGPLQISGNQWGFMYHSDGLGIQDDGVLGEHLLAAGDRAIPFLATLLDNPNPIFYEGSQEATLGNSLGYRVKDAAAYYIGRIAGIPVTFYDKTPDRDAEIERIKEILEKERHG